MKRDIYYTLTENNTKVILFDIDADEVIEVKAIPSAMQTSEVFAESFAISSAAAMMNITATEYKADYLPLFIDFMAGLAEEEQNQAA